MHISNNKLGLIVAVLMSAIGGILLTGGRTWQCVVGPFEALLPAQGPAPLPVQAVCTCPCSEIPLPKIMQLAALLHGEILAILGAGLQYWLMVPVFFNMLQVHWAQPGCLQMRTASGQGTTS